MTNKLYYNDTYLKEFDAVVLECVPAGDAYRVVLDASAFYPEGGGQPCDLGTLNGIPVTDVHEKNGIITHTCTAPLAEGETVHGVIDWARRFDLMQQHSGEHVVSGLVHARYGYDNVGFHMGKDMITIDFNGEIDPAGLLEIQQAANEAIWANLPVEVFYPTREELKDLPYRSKKEIEGQVRLVRFPGIDLCACCGTHVARTGEIGIIQFFSCVRFRDGVRIELLSGGRCLEYLQKLREQNRQVSTLLSARPTETAEAVSRIARELEQAKLRIASLEKQHFAAIAEAHRGEENILLIEEPLSGDGVRILCDQLLSVCAGRAMVFAGSDETGYKYALGSHGEDLRPLGKQLNAALNGRGGGKPNFLQGSLTATAAAIRSFFE